MSTNFYPVLVPITLPENTFEVEVVEIGGIKVCKGLGGHVCTFNAPDPGTIPGFENVDVWARRTGRGMTLAIPLAVIVAFAEMCEKLGYKMIMVGYSYPPVWWGDVKDFVKLAESMPIFEQYGENFS